MTMLTSTEQTKMEMLIVGSLLNTRAHSLLYSGVCSSSRVCAGVCEGGSMVSCNEPCHIHISSIVD